MPRLPDDLSALVRTEPVSPPEGLTVACYIFPHYHRSALNDRLYAPGWTEYSLMRGCRPWFPGHQQPRTPLWGELDEREPATWERYIDLAQASGIAVFIFDWYWYGGEPVLHEALEEGFLRARGRERMRFAVMWTNHPWYRWFPTAGHPAPAGDRLATFGTAGQGAREFLYPAPESPEEIWRSFAYLISRYLHDPAYWRLGDQPVVVLWEVPRLVAALGVSGTRALLEELRAFARKLGHPGIHFHASQASRPVFSQLEALGIDSYGLYNPIVLAAAERPVTEELPDYGVVAVDVVTRLWPAMAALSSRPFFPTVSPGWDNSPRCLPPLERPSQPDRTRWPGTTIVVNESPAAFAALVTAALAFLNQRPTTSPVLIIGCWNEWTEGHYLLPDTRHGYGMARALARALTLTKHTPSEA